MRNFLFYLLIFSCACFSDNVNGPLNQRPGCDHQSYAKHVNLDVHTTKPDTTKFDLFPTIPLHLYDSIFYFNSKFVTDGFDYPVGKPNADAYYLARRFGEQRHLGEDWNSKTGGNTDLGDPVFAVGNGLVTFSRNVCCGWGNVIRVVHLMPNSKNGTYIESVYAHMEDTYVRPGDLITRGQQIGTIGTANGKYSAHLHLELRDFINMSLGPGYSDDRFGYLDPSNFIAVNRP